MVVPDDEEQTDKLGVDHPDGAHSEFEEDWSTGSEYALAQPIRRCRLALRASRCVAWRLREQSASRGPESVVRRIGAGIRG